ncbi:hypothetical protein BH18ACT9_BH18ACT9_18620 [soil metagenome]
MSKPEPSVGNDSGKGPVTESERRRHRARVFGEILPEGTSDEQAAWGDREPGPEQADEWLRRQVPPHHG